MPSTDAPERSDVHETQLETPLPEPKTSSSKMPAVSILCAALALAVIFLACLKPGSSDGYLFRVMAGQVISEKGIPATDPFTWSAPGHSLFLDGWLACLFFFQLNSHLAP